MKFSEALQAVIDAKGGAGMRRPSWREGTYITVLTVENVEGMDEDKICMIRKYRKTPLPFNACSRDMLADEWEVDHFADPDPKTEEAEIKEEPIETPSEPIDSEVPPWAIG